MDGFDNPLIIAILIFVSVLLLSWRFLALLFTQHSALQKKKQAQQRHDTPLDHFISAEALKKLQIMTALWIMLIGVLIVVLTEHYWAIPIAVGIGVFGYFTPPIYYNEKIARRNQEFDTNMLDFVMLVSNSIRGGLSLPGAIEMSIPSIGGCIQEEFSRALSEHRLGLNLQDALERINKRIDCENLKLFIATVTVTLATGGSASAILDNVVKTIRMRNAFQDRLRVRTARTKMEALIVSFVPVIFFLLLLIMEPSYVKPLFTHPYGWCAITITLIMQVIGYAIIKSIMTIDV